MTKRTRRNHSPAFKAKVALAARRSGQIGKLPRDLKYFERWQDTLRNHDLEKL